MNNTFLKAVGLAGALTMVAAQGHAQINNSTSLTIGISTSGTSGSFVPSSGGSGNSDNGGSGRGSVSPAAIARLNLELKTDGGGITSPVTGEVIKGAPAYDLGELLNDVGTGEAHVTTTLNASGMNSALIAALVKSLNNLNNPDKKGPAIRTAVEAFNALVNSSSTSPTALASQQMLAIQAALVQLVAGLGNGASQ